MVGIQGDDRLEKLKTWLSANLGRQVEAIAPASSDASFRRYFRAQLDTGTYIVMDAPPPQENVEPFMAIAALLRGAGVQAPRVHAADPRSGFLLLDDFGSSNYLDRLDAHTADSLYGDALEALARLQKGVDLQTCGLPLYGEALLRAEMDLFRDWFLGRLLGLRLTDPERALLERVWARLIRSALEQPQVCVHRDYHSRNLMVTEAENPGVLDFQDAVIGPLTYDLVSLLKDCYIAWPRPRIESWIASFLVRLEGHRPVPDLQQLTAWFDLMGLQRHLKAIGIFARLKLRDGKPAYLRDIPRTLNYALETCKAYPELSEFGNFLEERVAEAAEATLGKAA